MATGLVDWTALGLPLLDHIFGPTPAISTNVSQRTAHETYFINWALAKAQDVVDNPNDFGTIGPHGQYGGYRTFYRLYYSTGQIYPQLLTAANRLIEVFRDGLLGHPPSWWDVTIMQAFIEGDQEAGNSIINPYHNPNAEGWAAYSLINPSLEAAATRKTKDIVKFYAAAAYHFLGVQHQDANDGAREGGVTQRWVFMFYILWGPTATVDILDDTLPVPAVRAYTAAEMLEDCIQQSQILITAGRPYFGWDADAPAPGSNLYIGNTNLAGSNSQGTCRIDRYFRKQGTPDTRLYPEIKKHFVWLETGFAPGIGQITSNPGSAIQTGGTQWVPGLGPYTSTRWRGAWRYYYYHNPENYSRPNNNGVHPETETVNSGHLVSTYAWGGAVDPNATDKSTYIARVNDVKEGMIRWVQDNVGAPGVFWDPRNWTEFAETWQEAEGLLLEAGNIEPPEQGFTATPTAPVVNEIVTATVTGGPGNATDWIAFAPNGSPLTTYLDSWKYLANNAQTIPSSGVVNGSVTIQAPAQAGVYELRFLANDGFTLVPGFVPIPMTVGGGGPNFQAVLSKDGASDDLYTVTLAVSPQQECLVRWHVNNELFPDAVIGRLVKPLDKRYLVDINGRARYLTGLHNWNNVTEWGNPPTTPGNPPSTFDWPAYLERLQDEAHTVTRMWCLGDFVHFVGGAPPGAAFRKKFPWARSTTPGAEDGGNKWDLTQFDQTWFDTLRTRVQNLNDAGIVAVVLFFNGWDSVANTGGTNIWHAVNNITVDGDPNNDGLTREAYTLSTIPPALLAAQKAYVHKVVDTLNDLDNVVWEMVNEPSGPADAWVAHMVADLRAYESSKPFQHPLFQGFYAHDGTGSTNAQLWNLDVDAVAPGSLASGGASPDGTGDYATDPPASSGDKVVVLDTDHLFGVGGDRDLIWKAFTRGLNPIYMDTTLDVDFFNPPTPAPQYQRARDAMGLTAQIARRLRADLNVMTPQAQGTATPVNTGYALYTTANDPLAPLAIAGWGASTVGGTGQPDVHVTNLNNSGAGSLREALSAGNRNVVFDVTGSINLASNISIGGNNITIKGLDAASPVTLNGWGLTILNRSEIIIEGLRIRNAGAPNDGAADGIGITGPGSHHIVVRKCSITGATDGTIDINGGCQFITVQECLLSGIRTMLIGQSGTPDPQTERITLWRNVWIGGNNDEVFTRYPLVRPNNYVPTDMTVDIRNNVLHGWLRANGMEIENTGRVNVVNNLFIPSPTTTLDQRQQSLKVATPSLAYVAGNVEQHAAPTVDYNTGYGSKATPWTAPTVETLDAMTAAQLVVASAGVTPRDATDQALLARLPITGVFPTGSDATEVVVYQPAGGPNPVTVDLTGVSASLSLDYVWQDPVTALVGGTGTVAGGAVRNFTPPNAADWVLFIRRLDLPYSLFGFNGTDPIPGNLGTGTFVVRADIYEVTGESLLAQRELTIVNAPPNGTILEPTAGWIFQPPNPLFEQKNYIIVQPGSPAILGAQVRITPVVGGTPVNVGAELTVLGTDGNFHLDPFDPTVYADGDYNIDAVMRDASSTSVTPPVGVTIRFQAGVRRQGRRLRGRLP